MRLHEVRERSNDELRTLERHLQEDLYSLRVNRATSQLGNTSALREKRRELAQVLTVLRARELNIEAHRSSAGTPAGEGR